MIALGILYGLLIVTAIVIVPLRIRSRRRTLREIESLRLQYRKDVSKLIETIRNEYDYEEQEKGQFEKVINQCNLMIDDFDDYLGRSVFASSTKSFPICFHISTGQKEYKHELRKYGEEQDKWVIIKESQVTKQFEPWGLHFEKHSISSLYYTADLIPRPFIKVLEPSPSK